jgi:Family of unknown function (DUF6526)
MGQQNLRNHRKYVAGFHFITLFLIVVLIIGSIMNLVHRDHSGLFDALLICLVAVILSLVFFYMRQFPLRVQNRAIRAEENLRHFVLTGRLLDNRLRMGQIIALRFAPDEEFVLLAKKAAEENFSNEAIKREIKNWREDHHRA